MESPSLAGTLGGLKVLEPSDLPRYKAAVAKGRQVGWGYYFPYLLARNRPGRRVVLLGEDDGSMCVFLWRRRNHANTLDLLVAPTPMNVSVLRRCLERANDFNRNRTARVLRIDAKDSYDVSRVASLRVRERKTQYVYTPTAFNNLGGRSYRTLRRQLARIAELTHVDVAPYSSAHEPACLALLREWARRHRAQQGTAGGVATAYRVIELVNRFSATDLRGEVVLIDGRVCAFSFGGEIRRGVGCFVEAKSDNEIRGLSYFQRYSFLSKMQEFELVNDGSDAGRAGLRQIKNSLRPSELHKEYRAFQIQS
ncbi:MAG: hypothetical protein HKP27_04875 [Myxococcales bacterium]|nr:hypothetical protein [Myxococcales bacterium]